MLTRNPGSSPPSGALADDGDDPHTVDQRLSAAALAAGVGDLVLARQVVEIPGGTDQLGRLAGVGKDVEAPVRADRRPGASSDVADVVAAAVQCGQAVLGELAHHRRDVSQPEIVHLQRLARGHTDAALCVGLDDSREAPDLRGRQHATRHHDARHEVVGMSRGVDAVGLGDLRFFRGHPAAPRELVEVEQQAALLDHLVIAASEIGDAALHALAPRTSSNGRRAARAGPAASAPALDEASAQIAFPGIADDGDDALAGAGWPCRDLA